MNRTSASPKRHPSSPAPTGFGRFALLASLALCLLPRTVPAAPAPAPAPGPTDWISPAALAATADGRTLYVACTTGNRVLQFDPDKGLVVSTFNTPYPPTGVALSPDGSRLVITFAGPTGGAVVIDTASGRATHRLITGHTPMSPVLTPDGGTLFVCNRFHDDIGVHDLTSGKEIRRIPAVREPVAAAITPDGKYLLVANHLHAGRADLDTVAASVTVIDVAAGTVLKQLALPNGSGALNALRISPDGRYAVVTHILARFHLPTTQLERGWVNTNAETLIDLATLTVLNTVLLDDVDSGAAVPWGVAWSADGRSQVVTHAGTHEVSVIDFPALLAKLAKLPVAPDPTRDTDTSAASRIQADVPNDLAFLRDVRRRIRLPEADQGPRAVVVIGSRVFTANYFSDSLSVIPLTDSVPIPVSIALGPKPVETAERRGERLFNDAKICFQTWQSCASCHPGDARVDALNWDLLNDGLGNPKNNKSLLLSHRTPPAMSLAIRDTAEVAVRAGIRHILFTVQPDDVAQSMDAYLKSLRPVPSPRLERGKLSTEARRGRRIFNDSKVGCATCHPSGLFTDLKPYDVGTKNSLDGDVPRFDTPTLIEVWRTAPYLHDGSAATVRELFSERNPQDRHGRTSHLSPTDLDDLATYVLSL
jgi:DNA-binding beta-propeller fold protein YncE/mono/diheme cytochrome c family protein